MTQLQSNTKQETQYDKIGAAYLDAQQQFYLPRNDWARDFVRTPVFAHKKYKILDLGCGAGNDIAFFESRGHTVFGIDESSYMLDRAKKVVRKPERLQHGGIEQLCHLYFQNRGFFSEGLWGDFDYIFARYSLHYTSDDIDELFQGVHFALKDNGVFAFVVPNPIADVPFTDTKNYATAKKVKLSIFNDTVQIEYPFRKTEELLTPYFQEFFRIQQIEPYTDGYAGASAFPAALAVVAQKPISKYSLWREAVVETCIETDIMKSFNRRRRLVRAGKPDEHPDDWNNLLSASK